MKEVSELHRMLEQFLTWNKARLDCFSRMLLALFASRTVNLSEMAIAMPSKTAVESRYKRLQRFFRYCTIDYNQIAKFIFSLFFEGKKVYLTIDRTNWFWGRSKINILMLAVAYEGISIPLFWCLLNKAGNATAREHQAMISRFIRVLGSDCIAGVLGDREFASGSFFSFLSRNHIPFYIRIKENAHVRIKSKKWLRSKALFAHLTSHEIAAFQMSVWIYGQKLYESRRCQVLKVQFSEIVLHDIP